MKVLVASNVWSASLRRGAAESSLERLMLAGLIQDQQVQMIGCIRQEVLQRSRDRAQFEWLRSALWAFPDRTVSEAEYELAAEFYNTCRRHGIQGSSTDYLIAACSVL